MTPYPYRALQSKVNEVRLVSIEPVTLPCNTGTEPQPVLKLTHASLDSSPAPAFAALSYVWGSGQTVPITIDDNVVAVTQNLQSALARLHRERFTGCIWIDALCINQSDTSEKNSQVPLMARIYSQAENIFVWLGPEPDHGALKAVQQLGSLFREQVRNVPGAGAGRIAGFVKTVRDFSITASSPRSASSFDFEAIWRLFRERSWWRRVWIIQEVVLARRAVFLCGEEPAISAPWEDIRDCLRAFEWMILYPDPAPEYKRLYQILGDVYPNVFHLGVASDRYKQCLTETPDIDHGEGGMSLMETMTWTSYGTGGDDSIQATDPRDRIFGLLAMIRLEDRQKIPVDYSPNTTLNHVLLSIAKELLVKHGPDLLSLCRETHLTSTGLPSWVPDWTARRIPVIGDVLLDVKSVHPYNASKGTIWSEWALRSKIKNAVYENPRVFLPGLVVGRVGAVGREFSTLPDAAGFISDCKEWLEELRAMVDEASEADTESVNLTDNQSVKTERLRNVWRVPLADFGLVHRPTKQEAETYIRGYKILTDRLPPPSELDEETKKAWIASETWNYRQPWKIYDRRSFVDSDGRPGLGPNNMSPGDSIAIFAGGHVPFILRQRGEDDTTYCLLGSAYVYGMMDGEATGSKASFSDIALV